MSNQDRYFDEANAGTFGHDAGICTTEHSSPPSQANNIESRLNEDDRVPSNMNSTTAVEHNRQSDQETPFHKFFGSNKSNQKSFITSRISQRVEEFSYKAGSYGGPMRHSNSERVTHLSNNIITEHEQATIMTSNVRREDWFTIEITSRTPLELLQVNDAYGNIPLNSPCIRLENPLDKETCRLHISIQPKKKSEPYVLRGRSKHGPWTWKCIVKNHEGKRSCKIERENPVVQQVKRPPIASSYVHDPFMINILLIGRSQVGKSTLIEVLRDPNFSATRTGISQTREPSCKQLTMSSEGGETYTLNIIDTPGLHEVRQDLNETRTNEQLLALLRNIFTSGQVRALNVICFVSVVGKTYQNDVDTFKSLIDFFGERFKSISALILTHCDKISIGRLQQLTEDVKTHPKCSDVVDYCRLGIYHHGTLDVDDLDTFDEEMRDRIRKSTLERLQPMHAKLTEFLLSRSSDYVEIQENDFERFQELLQQTRKPSERWETTFQELKEQALTHGFLSFCTIL